MPPNNIVREYFGLNPSEKGINNPCTIDYTVFLKKGNEFGNLEDVPF